MSDPFKHVGFVFAILAGALAAVAAPVALWAFHVKKNDEVNKSIAAGVSAIAGASASLAVYFYVV